MKRIFVTLILAGLSLCSYASGDWKGRILDENGQALPYATVALLTNADSTLVAGTTSASDGSFKLVTSKQSGILMVSMVGYRTLYTKPVQDCILKLEPDVSSLSAATATATLPKTRLAGEGLRTSVRGSVLENIGTAKDVLEKTPGIIKTQDGIQVLGKGSPLIYINGRKMVDASELERIQSNEIQSVEVITNPGAQYDASVMCVVRIRTVRRDGEGFGFNAALYDDQSLRVREFNDPSADVNANYRYKNIDIFGGVNVEHFSNRQESDLVNKVVGTPEFNSTSTILADYASLCLDVSGGVNWQIADNHSVGFRLDRWSVADYTANIHMTNNLMLDNVPFDGTVTDGLTHNAEIAPHYLSSNVYYNGVVGKMGIDFNADYYSTFNSELSEVDESSMLREDAQIKTATVSDSRLWASKLVLSYPIWKGQLQAGTEETFTRSGDDYSISGTDIPNSVSSVREDNYAGFATYSFALPKLGQFSAGLRYEHVKYAYSALGGDGSFDRNYDNFFPTFSYASQVGPVSLMLNYSEKTRRPDFSMMSNAIQYDSRYILESGNAALQPQTLRDASLMANVKWLSLTADWTRVYDAIMSWTERYNDEGVVLMKPLNMEKPYDVFVAYLNASPTIGVWSLNYTAGMYNQWLTIDAPDPREASGVRVTDFSGKPIFYLYLSNAVSLKGGWQLELGTNVSTSGYQQNILSTNTYFDLNAAVQKAFLRDKSLVVRLSAKDLAGLANFNYKTDFGSVFIEQNNIYDNRRITLSIRYKFNTTNSKYKGTGAGQDVIDRMGSGK